MLFYVICNKHFPGCLYQGIPQREMLDVSRNCDNIYFFKTKVNFKGTTAILSISIKWDRLDTGIKKYQ